ncbi:hypothetical protein [Streptomyces collinus]|uniref:hypothetical protein n=1 Tax=Streptomyces collinus TaxID=42684 RepID=UPI003830380D
MSCEDTPTRLTWEIQLHEPHCGVWICKGYGRATTTADPADIARAVLAGYLAASPPRATETLRAVARPDGGKAVTVGVADLAPDAVTDPAVRQALPLYLRDALPAGG